MLHLMNTVADKFIFFPFLCLDMTWQSLWRKGLFPSERKWKHQGLILYVFVLQLLKLRFWELDDHITVFRCTCCNISLIGLTGPDEIRGTEESSSAWGVSNRSWFPRFSQDPQWAWSSSLSTEWFRVSSCAKSICSTYLKVKISM